MQSRQSAHRWVRLLVLAALVFSSAWIVPVSLAQAPDATVIPQVLNMRSGPGEEYPVVVRLAEGTGLTLLARDDLPNNGIWVVAVTSDGTEGWVSSDYLTIREGLNVNLLPIRTAPPVPGETPAASEQTESGTTAQPQPAETGGFPEGSGLPAQAIAPVNFRSGPGKTYATITTLAKGTRLLARGRNETGTWIFVTTGGAEGWLYIDFVELFSGSIMGLPVVGTVVTNPQAPAAQSQTSASTNSTTGAAVPAPVAGGVGLTGFGYGGHVESFSYPDLMHGAGMTWAKRQIRFRPGMGGSAAAGAIDEAHGKGFKVLLGIVGYPEDMGTPGYFEDYARFVGEVAALGPDAIEVWNEQNLDREWPAGQIDPARYTQLLALAYNAIKSANPKVAVISGAPSPTGAEGAFGSARVWNDDRYVRGMAAAGAARYMDCIGAHYNEGIVAPSQRSGDPRDSYYTRYFWGMVDTYYGAFGGARPVCFTELGYVTPEGYGPLPGGFAWGSGTSVAQQAAWLAEAVSLSRSSGKVKLVIIWNVDFTSYGGDPMAGYAIIRPGGVCPACNALAGR